MADLVTNINQAVSDFNNIKQAIINKGVDVPEGTKTSEYAELINEISGGGGDTGEQLGIYPVGTNGRPTGDAIVPEGVTSLHQWVFRQTDITSVTLPSTLTSIGEYAFERCYSLAKIIIPNNVASLGTRVFEECDALTELIFPEKISTIPDYCIYGANNINKITIQSNASHLIIGESGFAPNGSSSLTTFIIPDTIESIELGTNAFYKTLITDEYANIILSKTTSQGTNCFSHCNNLVNIAAKYTNDNCFNGCSNLKTVVIDNVLNTGDSGQSVFRDCSNLESVVYGEQAKANMLNFETSYFYGCTSLKEFEMPPNVTSIGTSIFRNCTSLTKISLPSTITTASYSCLTTTDYYHYFLQNCPALEELVVGKDWNMNLRLNVSSNLTVDGMVNLMNNLKDLTGETAKTLTLGETNLAKLTDEQKAIATNKNWTLA